ncbi:MAG: hypothetical protein GX200_05840 [Firmicutes bacterium]|nr:hypothetical protein [Bacillota bacterium]
MKKVKFLALALVLLFGLMGGAYAYWANTMMLDGTVQTGKLEHTWIYSKHASSYPFKYQPEWHYISIDNFDGPTSWYPDHETFIGNALPIGMYNMYPGAVAKYTLRIENTGTVPSKVKAVNIKHTGGPGQLYNYLEGKADIMLYDNNNVLREILLPINNNWENLSDFENTLYNALVNVVLYPGWTIRFGADDEEGGENTLYFRINPEAPNTLNGVSLQNQTVEFEIEFEFVQWNYVEPNPNV